MLPDDSPCIVGREFLALNRLSAIEDQSSKAPRGVAPELWSLGLLYNLVRLEKEQNAAEAGGADPHQLHLQFIQNCWIICAAMAPARIPRRLQKLREELCQFILPPRRSERLYPHAAKIRMSAYPKNRSKPSSVA